MHIGVHTYIYMYIYVYIYICDYICIHTHFHTHTSDSFGTHLLSLLYTAQAQRIPRLPAKVSLLRLTTAILGRF